MNDAKRTITLLACCCIVLTIAPPASADYVGVTTVIKNDQDTVFLCTQGKGKFVPGPLKVCNVFAQFDDPTDRLLSVGTADVSTSDPLGYFQHDFGNGNTSPACNLLPVFPDLICDSFVTIGVKCSDGNDGTSTDPDFNLDPHLPPNLQEDWFNEFGHLFGGWFNANPFTGQGDAGQDPPNQNLQVLIMQLSVTPNETITGTLDVFARIGGDINYFFDQPVECALPPCEEGDACDDGDACTESDFCVNGVCVGTPLDCSVLDDQCLAGVCNPDTGECEAEPVSEGEACDDGDPCTACDACTDGTCAGEPAVCPKGQVCDAGACVPDVDPCACEGGKVTICHFPPGFPENGQTISVGCRALEAHLEHGDFCGPCEDTDTECANDAACDDGSLCTLDVCNPESGCTYEMICCDDGDACTLDSCDVDTGCSNEPIDCDDDDACTIDSCDAATGCVNDPIDCDDGDVCTADACDPDLGCVHLPFEPCCGNDVVEGDEQCDGTDDKACPGECNSSCTCGASDCCIPHDTPGCDDEACEAAVCGEDPFCCNPAGNWDILCVNEAVELCGDLCEAECADDSHCDDGAFCNGAETCDVPSGTCQQGTEPCDVGETCDEDNDVCIPPSTDGACCDGETCSVTTEEGCVDGGGEYQGDDTMCDPNPCVPGPAEGACCDGETCSVTTEADCIDGGGDYQGDDTVCDPNPCAPAESDCCIPHDTPGCDNKACEAAVCDQDPFCCNPLGNWDVACVSQAVELCGDLCEPPSAPVNDDCEDSIEIFDGETEFDTTNASTDGQAHSDELCQFDGQTYKDIWYDHFATCTGDLTVTTCEDLGGSAEYDTDIVVYDGCDICIPGDDLVLGCNDDDPVNPCGTVDYQSTVVVPVVSGNCYKIRIGGFKGGDSGTGTALIACEP